MLHARSMSLGPAHGGFRQRLLRTCCPPPQGAEQSPQGPHGSHPVSSSRGVVLQDPRDVQ